MQSRRLTTASKKRRGFTLIELLVVISIIATLMSLILPAIQQAREAGRRTQCLNNLRNVTVAMHNYASSNRSRLPALAYFPTNGSAGNIEGRSWVVDLLPYMDQQGAFDRWNKGLQWTDNSTNDGAGADELGYSNSDLAANLYIEALACPNDESAFSSPGGLSYVANSGFGDETAISNAMGNVDHSFAVEPFDWNGDTNVPGTPPGDENDVAITKATGVFWPEFSNVPATRNGSSTLGKVYDGTSNTIMLGENLRSGVATSNWADPRTRACAFVLPITATNVDNTTLRDPLAAVINGGFPNQSENAVQGTVASLNSGHVGIVVVAFVDGSVRTISEDLDRRTYVKLVTPDGTRLRAGFQVEEPLSGDF